MSVNGRWVQMAQEREGCAEKQHENLEHAGRELLTHPQ